MTRDNRAVELPQKHIHRYKAKPDPAVIYLFLKYRFEAVAQLVYLTLRTLKKCSRYCKHLLLCKKKKLFTLSELRFTTVFVYRSVYKKIRKKITNTHIATRFGFVLYVRHHHIPILKHDISQ